MSYYIYSTLANNMKYVDYDEPIEGQKIRGVRHSVTIEGKVGVANKNFITPRGAVTKVSDEDFKMLEKNTAFKDHVKNGFIKYEKKEASIDKVVKDMKARDVSAPITPDFYKNASPTLELAQPMKGRKRRA